MGRGVARARPGAPLRSAALDGRGPAPSGRDVLGLQLVLLDAGLLLALYAAWRAAPAARNFLPWAAVATGLWLTGAWIYLQPMPMRGMVH